MPSPSRLILCAALAACTQAATAGVVLSPVAVSSSLDTVAGSTTHLIDRSGLNVGFSSGITDFAAYAAGDPSHAACSNSSCWAAYAEPGYLQFDLGAVYGFSAMALWLDGNASNPNNIASFSLTSATDEAFTSNISSLGSFIADQSGAVQVFNVSGIGRYVRLNLLSDHGGEFHVLGEVAFDVNPATVPEPEPAGLGLVACALAAAGWGRKRRTRPLPQ
jgi:hypothetical protein